MSKEIKGYILYQNKEKYPIGKITDKVDIKGNRLFTGDVVTVGGDFLKGEETVVCTKYGQIMGIFEDSLTQKGIKKWNVIKIKSYKDLKDGEVLFKNKNLKVVLEEKPKQNKVENIKHIINGTTTIVILENGNKGISKCHPQDKFDKYEGFRIAYARACGTELDNKGNKLKVNEKLWKEFINGRAVIKYNSFEDMKFLICYLHKQGFREIGDEVNEKYLEHIYTLCDSIRLINIRKKAVTFDVTDMKYIQSYFNIITFEELFPQPTILTLK